MQLRWFRYFVAVVEAGSFSQAARHLGVAQPALSRCLQEMEAHFGTRLLLRAPRGLSMTEEGTALYASALDILRRIETTYQSVASGHEASLSGRIVIGLPTSANEVLAAELVREAREVFPNVQLHIIESMSGFLTEWVQSGRVDLALLFDLTPNPALDLTPLIREELWLYGPPDAMAALPQDAIAVSQLTTLPLVTPALPHGLRQQLGEVLARQGLSLAPLAEIDSLQAILQLIASGHAYSVLARSAASAWVEAGRIEGRALKNPALARNVVLARSLVRPSSRLSEEMAKLCTRVCARLHAEGRWPGQLLLHPTVHT